MSCRKAAERLSRAQDGPLPRGERMLLLLHLALCGACRRARAQWRLLHRALRERLEVDAPEPEDARLDDAARERIRRALTSVR